VTASGRGRAGAKVVLLGEHAVVYDRPALAAGVPIHLDAEAWPGEGPRLEAEGPADERGAALVGQAAEAVGLDPRAWIVRVRSQIPPGRGLGSSAALCVATLRALADAAGRPLPLAGELEIGRRLEVLFHGTPSGIDPAAAALGCSIRFRRGEPPEVTPLSLAAALPLVIAWGGEARRTAGAVGGLRERWERDRARYEALFDAVAELVNAGERALVAGDLAAFGRACDDNQRLLEAMGVSSPDLEARLAVARGAGALGAKLTGGGAGGAVIAVAPDGEGVEQALRAAGATVLRVLVPATR
jgi:mevalonate kinase